ncbi:hypothetical protein D3C87_1270050 [compost metagenome]
MVSRIIISSVQLHVPAFVVFTIAEHFVVAEIKIVYIKQGPFNFIAAAVKHRPPVICPWGSCIPANEIRFFVNRLCQPVAALVVYLQVSCVSQLVF